MNCCILNYCILSAAVYRATARTLEKGFTKKMDGRYCHVETPVRTFFYDVDVSGSGARPRFICKGFGSSPFIFCIYVQSKDLL